MFLIRVLIKRKLSIIALLCMLLSFNISAEVTNIPLQHVRLDFNDKASLQRGVKYFTNYCTSCHSMSYLRYNRMAKDLNITDDDGNILKDLLKAHLMFNTDKVSDHMMSSISKSDAKTWFGVVPPDLTMATRSRSPDWVYTYLKSFYIDSTRTWGVNNLIFKDVAMPHVLANLQGEQLLTYSESYGSVQKHVGKLELVKSGKLTEKEYDHVVTDIVNFMNYAAEPNKDQRIHMGIGVLLFLGVLLVFVYMLKREYWKDIH
mgnify:CR=1 FL=1|tara:strand:- start:18877 stop:19656 length:780 start_codon:yes stop_codon:yes gene_type:complete